MCGASWKLDRAGDIQHEGGRDRGRREGRMEQREDGTEEGKKEGWNREMTG